MKTHRVNALMAGIFYLLGSVFGILGLVVGGEVFSSISRCTPLSSPDLLGLVIADSSRLVNGSFFILLMGISLVAMTVFLYPVFRKDSEELAAGLLLFRGAIEGSWYVLTTLIALILFVLGKECVSARADVPALHSMIIVAYRSQDRLAPVGTLFFLIGSTCLYLSFFRTRLIPRWLSVWGLIGVAPYMAYALMHYFRVDGGIGLYLQMILAPQEMVMAFWLIIKGFNRDSIGKLMTASTGAVGDTP